MIIIIFATAVPIVFVASHRYVPLSVRDALLMSNSLELMKDAGPSHRKVHGGLQEALHTNGPNLLPSLTL